MILAHASGEVKKLTFSLRGLATFPPRCRHECKLATEFGDEDQIVERWTPQRNGQDTDMVNRLARESTAPSHPEGSS